MRPRGSWARCPAAPWRSWARTFTVASVLNATGSQEDGLIYADLGVVQGLLGKPGKVSLVEVSALCSTCPIEDIVSQIGDACPARRSRLSPR